jgi:ribonuclease HII
MSSLPPLPRIESEALKEGSLAKTAAFLKSALADDPRSSAHRLVLKYEKLLASESEEQQRLESLWFYEKKAQAQGALRVAGVDEAGRGPLVGPVMASAVILPPDFKPVGLNDSKKVTPEKRKKLFGEIQKRAVSVGVGQASAKEIDEINIYRAAQLAMERAIHALAVKPDYLLTDAMPLPVFSALPQLPLVHGDALSASIAAASIVAKVTRDEWMGEYHEKFPQYGFQSHKGYGTEEHLRALQAHGTCPEHRMTFGPVMETQARQASGGPLAYWSGKINGSKDIRELQRAGIQIKRIASDKLSSSELDQLRKVYREKRTQWQAEGA